MNPYKNNDSSCYDCCFASSALIFWKSRSKNPESELKELLSNYSINYKDLESQTWDSETATIGGIRDYKLSQISINANSWVSLMLHTDSNLIDRISIGLSKITESPVIAFLEYNQDAWGYCLFENGKLLDNFWNSGLTVEQEANNCAANIELIASKFQVDKDLIKPYLISNTTKENFGKAFESDEFYLEDHWVRVDFMEKLGLVYPETGKWFYIIETGINDN